MKDYAIRCPIRVPKVQVKYAVSFKTNKPERQETVKANDQLANQNDDDCMAEETADVNVNMPPPTPGEM